MLFSNSVNHLQKVSFIEYKVLQLHKIARESIIFAFM